MARKYSSVHYHDYLQLGKILDAQKPRSEISGKAAHDEMLFIITHQVYELWFKEIIHELRSVMKIFGCKQIDGQRMSSVVERLKRIIEIQKVLVDQIKVLETMTPLDFWILGIICFLRQVFKAGSSGWWR